MVRTPHSTSGSFVVETAFIEKRTSGPGDVIDLTPDLTSLLRKTQFQGVA